LTASTTKVLMEFVLPFHPVQFRPSANYSCPRKLGEVMLADVESDNRMPRLRIRDTARALVLEAAPTRLKRLRSRTPRILDARAVPSPPICLQRLGRDAAQLSAGQSLHRLTMDGLAGS
jgi:hypothetical protein